MLRTACVAAASRESLPDLIERCLKTPAEIVSLEVQCALFLFEQLEPYGLLVVLFQGGKRRNQLSQSSFSKKN